jgi:hypothetical protein
MAAGTTKIQTKYPMNIWLVLYIAFIKHTPAIATESFLLTYSFYSQHVLALSGHPQVNRNTLYLVTHLQKTIATSTDPFF